MHPVSCGRRFDGSTRASSSVRCAASLGASYYTRIAGKDLTLRAALGNVTNKRYWAFQFDNYLQPGEPRNVSLNAKISF